MKLSFVIPAFNEENTIGQCITSIFKETKGENCNIEIIVVNNASTDKTKKVALSFPGVKVIDEPVKGLVRARQKGFLTSSGSLIANIDADSLLTPGWVKTVLKEFNHDPELIALSGPCVCYDLSKLANFGVYLFYRVGFIVYLINNHLLKIGSLLQGGNFIVKRSALEKIGGYNLKFNFYGEDTDIACRLRKVGKVKFTLKLPVYTSGRRLKAEGILSAGIRYGINHFWTILFHKPFTKESVDIRAK